MAAVAFRGHDTSELHDKPDCSELPNRPECAGIIQFLVVEWRPANGTTPDPLVAVHVGE